MTTPLCFSQIVWVTIPDPQGRNPKCRPAVVYTPTEEIAAEGFVDVVAITSRLDQSPSEMSVAIPWQRGGHPRTKLNRPSEAVCSWTARLPVVAVQATAGRVPLAEMNRLLELLYPSIPPPSDPP